jgi:hypothetical protein
MMRHPHIGEIFLTHDELISAGMDNSGFASKSRRLTTADKRVIELHRLCTHKATAGSSEKS